jgi:methyl-accepting chemotaxis protein
VVANEISAQIVGMRSATQDSVTALKEIGGTIGWIIAIASTIAAAVEEQGTATQEISRNIRQAANGTTKVASNILEVNQGAAESSRLATEMDRFLSRSAPNRRIALHATDEARDAPLGNLDQLVKCQFARTFAAAG